MITGWKRLAIGLASATALVAPMSAPALAVSPALAPAASQEFFGFGLSAHASAALAQARASATSQATAAGYASSQCKVTYQDVSREGDDPPRGLWTAEVDLLCSN
jgi:hypothetical protein